MILQDWWYTTLLDLPQPALPPLRRDVEADVVVIGAGMAGLMAALRLMEKGAKVVVLEKNICGGSSTGRSAGFLTPDSELELSQLIRRYGPGGARDLWTVPVQGIERILAIAKRYSIECDLLKQDSLFLGNGEGGRRDIEEEIGSRRRLGYGVTSYSAAELPKIIGTDGYSGGVRYGDTYGINALRFAQGVKRALVDGGVSVYESTEAKRIEDRTVYTHAGSVKAGAVVFCADKPKPQLTRYSDQIFHAQTFLSVSEPLSDAEVSRLFPDAPLQCWDSDLVYTYFRLTGDRRLLVGGGSALTTFALHYVNSPGVIGGVISRFKEKFPFLRDLEFIQYWPGLIDSTRDLLPTVLRDERAPWLHLVLGCVGLPWASFCGDFVARHALGAGDCEDHHYYKYFNPGRGFFLPIWLEAILGKPLVFSVNNAWAKYVQVDSKEASDAKASGPVG